MAVGVNSCPTHGSRSLGCLPLTQTHCELDDGLAVNLLRHHSAFERIEKSCDPYGRPMLALTFGLQGESQFLQNDGERLTFRAGFTTIAGFAASRGERYLPAGQSILQLRILLDERRLRQYTDGKQIAKWLGNDSVNRLAFSATTGVCHAHVRALACQMQQDCSRLDMQVHALSALAHALRVHLLDSRANNRLTHARIERLERARSLLLERLDCPLPLADLSAAVGLNECALKQGFRQRFGTTPRRLLHEARMCEAHTLLESGCQVAQAAYRVGYAHPGNFSVAFLRYYGYYPKAVFGKRR